MNKLSHQWLGFALLAVWALANVFGHWNNWFQDASALYFSAYFYDLGQFSLVYSPEPNFFWGDNPPAEWVALANSQGPVVGDMAPFVYPPIWAAIFAPLASKITALQFFNIVLAVNTAVIVGTIYLAYGFVRAQRITFLVWCLIAIGFLQFTTIGQLALELGQPQILVTLLIIAAFRATQARLEISAGVLLATAAAIKLAPGLLAILFVMERRWKALAVFAVVGTAWAAASFGVAGIELHDSFLTRLRDLDAHVLISRGAVTFDAILVQATNWAVGAPGWEFTDYWLQPEPGWVKGVNLTVIAAGLVVIFTTTKDISDDLRLWFRLLMAFMLFFCTGPLAWIHYLILPMFLLPGLLSITTTGLATAVLGLFFVMFSTVVFDVLFSQNWGANVLIFGGFITVVIVFSALGLIRDRLS